MKKFIAQGICLLLICVFLGGCCLCLRPNNQISLNPTSRQTLKQALQSNPSVLDSVRYTENKRLQFSDYIVYNAGDGMRDDLNATRYASGLVEVHKQFVTYQYVVECRHQDWKYFFEDFDDISTWALYQ